MRKPDTIPPAVREAIERHNAQHDYHARRERNVVCDDLKWDTIMGCYFFTRGAMFYGVELDGYIHT